MASTQTISDTLIFNPTGNTGSSNMSVSNATARLYYNTTAKGTSTTISLHP